MGEIIGKIDIHHHIIPEPYRLALEDFGISCSGGKGIKKWRPEDSLKLMDKTGIQTAIVSISEPALIPITDKEKAKKIAREVNEFQAEMIRNYPGRFGGFALLPLPDVDAALDEIRYALDELKLDGVGLLSNYQEQFLGDPIFDPIFDELNKRNAIVHMHPSAPPASVPRPKYIKPDYVMEFTFNTTRAVGNLLLSGTMERYPNIKIILSHGGGTSPFLRQRIARYYYGSKGISSQPNSNPSDYFDRFYYDTALTAHHIGLMSLKETAGISNILYGSDANFAPDELVNRDINQISQNEKLNQNEVVDILRNNALQLFPQFNLTPVK